MIVHICCSVDSWYFLERIRSDYPGEQIVGYFYNPNIHPQSEYETRKIDAKRSCDLQKIEFLEGEYELDGWFEAVKGLEDEPERGSRCSNCFDVRLYKTAQLADRLGHQIYTTTLLMSPKKDFSKLIASAQKLDSRFNSKFLMVDYRKGGGTQAQFKLAKEVQAYKQNYCGCIFALQKQRQAQGRFASELSDPLHMVDEASPQKRLDLYTKRIDLERSGVQYKIVKERFLNSRVLEGGIIGSNGEAIGSDIVSHSAGNFRFKAEPLDLISGVQYCEKNGVFIVTQEFAGDGSGLREKLGLTSHSLAPIFVVEKPIDQEITIFLTTKEWEDAREILVPIK